MRHNSVITQGMKDYFKKIISDFTSLPQDEEITGKVHAWLADKENEDRKNEALYSFWNAQEPECSLQEIDKALGKVYGKIEYGKKQRREGRARKIVIASLKYAAAVVLLAVTAATSWYLTREEYSNVAMIEDYTATGERKTVILPDGTQVQVNSSTVLIYPERFTGNHRTVFLQGEAMFDVVKNDKQPFTVRSGAVAVTALGTEFNVSAYSEEENVRATLLEGKVRVECSGENGKTYILTPGEQVSYSKGSGISSKNAVETDDVMAWTDGIMLFRGVTIEDILKTLHRKFGVSFNVDCMNADHSDKYNFRFRETASLEEIMEIIRKVSGNIEYEISGNICKVKIR